MARNEKLIRTQGNFPNLNGLIRWPGLSTYIFSSDEEPVKKVPLKQIVKPDTDKIKKPQKTNNNNFTKKEIKPLENDYRSERDQRTIFVKNLPFSSSVDDVSINIVQVRKK